MDKMSKNDDCYDKRWFSDNYIDRVNPLKRVNNVIHPPSLFKTISIFPVFVVFNIFVFIPLSGLIYLGAKYVSKDQGKKVQEQVSKTAIGVGRARDILFRIGLCDDNLAYIFIQQKSASVIHSLIALYTKFTSILFSLPGSSFGFVSISIPFIYLIFLTM